MAGLGQAVGVSRQSVYNEFGSKDQVATALVTREVSLFPNAVAEQMATGDSPAEALARAADTGLHLAEDNPLVHSMLGAAVGADSPYRPCSRPVAAGDRRGSDSDHRG